MIYLDNAATTFPKPVVVRNSVSSALQRFGANPGRSGYPMSMASSEQVYACRKELSEFLGGPGPENVAFVLNCTQAINMVLKGWLKPGDHVVTSDLEHNAVMRPLEAMKANGITVTEAHVTIGDHDATVDAFRKALNGRTRLIVCTHASNVWGARLPIERIGALAKEYQIPFAVDCAQSAGVLPLHMQEMGIDFLCVAGHKGLYGPMGTGALITARGSELSTILQGGTGSNSMELEQPEDMPDRFESGTVNVPGICGLQAGISFVRQRQESIFRHEMQYVQQLYDRLSRIPHVVLYTPRPEPLYFAPVLSCNIEGMSSEEVGMQLGRYGIAVRAGLHCAPAAHRAMGTLEQGTIRLAPSAFSNIAEINQVISGFSKIIHRNFSK